LLLQSYIAGGLGGIVIDAAATTAAITLAAAAYGVTTRRDLSSLGGILFAGLIGILVASLLGIFIHLAFLHLVISLVAAVVFTGMLVYDFNRVARMRMASTGDAIMMAVSIYLDILNLFLSLLSILQVLGGGSRR
jgi:FtsH-binding integral membrane protein